MPAAAPAAVRAPEALTRPATLLLPLFLLPPALPRSLELGSSPVTFPPAPPDTCTLVPLLEPGTLCSLACGSPLVPWGSRVGPALGAAGGALAPLVALGKETGGRASGGAGKLAGATETGERSRVALEGSPVREAGVCSAGGTLPRIADCSMFTFPSPPTPRIAETDCSMFTFPSLPTPRPGPPSPPSPAPECEAIRGMPVGTSPVTEEVLSPGCAAVGPSANLGVPWVAFFWLEACLRG